MMLEGGERDEREKKKNTQQKPEQHIRYMMCWNCRPEIKRPFDSLRLRGADDSVSNKIRQQQKKMPCTKLTD